MVILAAFPGIVRELLVNEKLVKPSNFSATVNFLGSRIRKVGLGDAEAAPNTFRNPGGRGRTTPRRRLRAFWEHLPPERRAALDAEALAGADPAARAAYEAATAP
jgi:hypothetical protein